MSRAQLLLEDFMILMLVSSLLHCPKAFFVVVDEVSHR